MVRRFSAGAFCLLALLLSGCDNNLWWEYRDDPYIANLSKKGENEVFRHLNGVNKDERQMALRIIAVRAGEERRRGNREGARRLEDLIIRRYHIEKEPKVRACIVRVCAPAVGRGSDAMVLFLRERMAAGEFPGYAALSLASLAPRGAFQDIEPLTRHPAPEVRFQAAVALTILGVPEGFEPVARVWRNMEPGLWPERVEGMTLADARASLGRRALRGFGRPLH